MIMAVDTTHELYDKFVAIWEKCLDAYEGQQAVKAKGDRYLPRLSGHIMHYDTTTADDRSRGLLQVQTELEYNQYLKRAVYYNYVRKVTDGLNEQLFRKNVKLEVPSAMQEIVDNFTFSGKSLRTAVKESNRDILLNYRSVLLLDYPRTETEKMLSQADVERMNIRPYGIYYKATDVINWNFEIINNKKTLTRVIIRETVEEQSEDDEFSMDEYEQYRVLDLVYQMDEEGNPLPETKPQYRIRLFRAKETNENRSKGDGKTDFEQLGEDIIFKVNGSTLDYIPCFFLTSKGISEDLTYPVMNDAVDLNLAHYINSADYENALNVTGSPTPVIIGYDNDPDANAEIALGGNRALLLYGQGANAFFLEYKGNGLESIKSAMSAKVDALSVIAGRMLQNDPKGIESAETAKIHRSAEQGQLSSMALSLAEAYEYILNIMATWLGVSGTIEVQFNTDYSDQEIDPQLLATLITARQAGFMSPEVFFYNLVRGEMVPEDWTIEKETDAISEEKQENMQLSTGFNDMTDEELELEAEETEEEAQ